MAIQTNFKEQITDLVDSLTSAEKLNFSEAIFIKSIETSPLSKDHMVVTGVRNGNLVPIIDNQPDYESFPFSDPNICEIPECDLKNNYSTNRWNLGLIECKVPICLRSFNDDFLLFWNQYKMIQTDSDKNESEYLQSALIQFLFDKFKTNHTAAQWRGAYFGDVSSTSLFFNGIDGWFTQMESNTSQIVKITKNDGATFEEQKMTGEEIYDILKEMYIKSGEQIWNSDQPLEFRMNESLTRILATYYTLLKDTKCCDGLQILDPDSVSNKPYPYQRLDFHGVPIKPMIEWDYIINKTSELNKGWTNGTLTDPTAARVNPNRIVLTYKNNLVFGTQEMSNLAFFDLWYSRDDDKIYMKGGSYFGASIPLTTDYILAI